MKVLPAVDLMGGRVVQLVGGDPEARAVDEPDAVSTAARWTAQGAPALHVVDLDAALGKGDNARVVERLLASARVPVQVGGGLRDTQAVERWLAAGANAAVVGTRALADPAWLTEVATRHPQRIVVAVDARGRRVVSRGWRHDTGRDVFDVVRELETLPLAGLLCTSVDVEGRMGGIDRAVMGSLPRRTALPVIASGGVSSVDDIRFLRRSGAAACVLGMALYTGRLTLTDAMRAAQEDA